MSYVLSRPFKLPLDDWQVLIGEPGIGKNALLSNWVKRRGATKHRDEFLFQYFAGASTRAKQLPHMLHKVRAVKGVVFCAKAMQAFVLQPQLMPVHRNCQTCVTSSLFMHDLFRCEYGPLSKDFSSGNKFPKKKSRIVFLGKRR